MDEIIDILSRDYPHADEERILECIDIIVDHLGLEDSRKALLLSSDSFADTIMKQSRHFKIDEYEEGGRVFVETHFIGKLHSIDDEPALVEFDDEGRIVRKEWHDYKVRDGPFRRSGGPATITYVDEAFSTEIWNDEKGKIERIETSFWGMPHSIDDRPSVVKFNDEGDVIMEWHSYKVKGCPFRESGGPAIVTYKNGSIVSEQWTDETGEIVRE